MARGLTRIGETNPLARTTAEEPYAGKATCTVPRGAGRQLNEAPRLLDPAVRPGFRVVQDRAPKVRQKKREYDGELGFDLGKSFKYKTL